MSNYCEPLLAALKDCVLHSDCVMKEGKLPSECIKHHIDDLPEECRSLRLAAFECKRGMCRSYCGENQARECVYADGRAIQNHGRCIMCALLVYFNLPSGSWPCVA